MEPLIGDIEIRMRRLKTNHERLESLLKALNEPEVSTKIVNVISILESFIDRHKKIDIGELYNDALNVHSLVSIEEIDSDLIERPSDHPKVIAQDRIISISNECLAIASAAKDLYEQSDQRRIEVISSELIEKGKFEENIQQISSRIEELESVLIKASQAEVGIKDSERHLTKLSEKININITTIKFAINVGEIVDLAVLERAVKSIYSAIQDAGIAVSRYIKSLAPGVMEFFTSIKERGIGLVESTRDLLVAVKKDLNEQKPRRELPPESSPIYNREWVDSQFKIIGKAIEDRRVGLGISRSDCSYRTRISLRYMQLIEKGELHNSHLAPVYVLGFTKTYLRDLGLDYYDLMRRLRNYQYYYGLH